MATIDLGRLGFVNKGTYNNSTTYEKNDLVQFTDGGILSTYLYIDSTAQSGQAPSSSGTAGSRWVFFAKGVTDALGGISNNNIVVKDNSGNITGLSGNNKIITTNNSGVPTAVSIGSANEFLKVNSGANGYEFGAVSSDFVKIAGGNTTSSGTIDITGCFSTDYKFYKLFCNHNFVSQSYIEVAMLNTNGTMDGATYYSRGNGEYSAGGTGNARWTGGNNQNTWNQSDTDGFRPINTWNSFQADEHSMVEMTFDNPIATRKTMVQWNATWSGGGSDHVGMSHGMGMLDSTNSHSGLRLSSKDNSINFTTTGYYAVYGLKN